VLLFWGVTPGVLLTTLSTAMLRQQKLDGLLSEDSHDVVSSCARRGHQETRQHQHPFVVAPVSALTTAACSTQHMTPNLRAITHDCTPNACVAAIGMALGMQFALPPAEARETLATVAGQPE
jgi:hypothetical protein